MLNRRSLLGGLSATLPLLAMPGALHAQARPRVLAMIVGINTYTGRGPQGPIKSLKGCLNDADDIERQVRRLGPASFVRLGWDAAAGRERGVTRDDFFAAWRETLAAAAKGDTLLLTFSGHGSQVPATSSSAGDEHDGMDETLVLSGYDVGQGRSAEHIVDDELHRLFLAAHAKGAVVVFVSDSCHSGTVYRSVDTTVRDTSYRYVAPPRAARSTRADGSSPSRPPPAAPNLLFLGGSQEDEAVPEIVVDGKYRGALSVAVARALEGGAATDSVVTALGLARFVRRHVRDLSDGGQHADVKWPTPGPAASSGTVISPTPALERGIDKNTPLFVLAAPPSPATTADGPVPLRILGYSAAEQQRVLSTLRKGSAVLAGEGQAAALVWDAERGLILNDQRHRIAENVDEGGLQHAVDRRLALDRLIPMAANGLDVKIMIGGRETPAADAAHRPGDRPTIVVAGVGREDYLTVFNFAGTGLVQVLEPEPYRRSDPHRADFSHRDFKTGRQHNRSDINLGNVDVRPPFGADHVIAVAGEFPLRRLMAALAQAHDMPAISSVMAAIASELETQPLKIGLRGIYTERR